MSKKKTSALERWLDIQKQKRKDAETQARINARKLAQNEQQLDTLNNFRSSCTMQTGSVRSGLTLNTNQQFHEQLELLIQHQSQQVALCQSQQRFRDLQLQDNHREVRKTEFIIERHRDREALVAYRQEQKAQDEMAGQMGMRTRAMQKRAAREAEE